MEDKNVGMVLNPLLEAQRKFSLIENRLFYLGLQDVNPHITEKDKFFDTEFPDTHITPSELQQLFGYDACLPEILKTCDSFAGTTIKICFEDSFEIYTVFQHMKYSKGKGLFIKFNEDMRPFLLDIYQTYKKYGFTKLEMKQLFLLNSSYAMRLLELILKYRSMAKNGIIEREISVNELREKLNVPENTYKTMCNFRSRVLNSPINDINTHTHYFITYKTVKKGRAVSGFIFYCNCTAARADDDYTRTVESTATEKEKALSTSTAPAPHEQEDKASEIEQKTLDKLIKYGFSLKVINQLTEKCGGIDELARRLEYGEQRAKKDIEKKKEIKSISGYLRRAIEENWLGAKAEEEKAQAKEFETVKNSDWVAWVKENFSNEPAPAAQEKLLNIDNPIDKVRINLIKKDIKEKRLTATSKNLLADSGLTVARFIELYMNK